MTVIAFIGLGNMGTPMAANLVKAGHEVRGFDLCADACAQARDAGVTVASNASQAVSGTEVVVTMLPEGRHVHAVYGDANAGLLAELRPGALCIDCSTIDVASARAVATQAADKGIDMIDAPVSGGVVGAEGATLTFMVGGPEQAVERARPYLEAMGKTVVHTGGAGNGQAAKICNNMILGISMIGVSEAFVLADRLGLDAQALFDVASSSSGQCWSLTRNCPVPGPVPGSPANRGYRPGFAVAMMEKDLKLAQEAARGVDCASPLGAQAYQIYRLFAQNGNEGLDFSSIIKLIEGKRA